MSIKRKRLDLLRLSVVFVPGTFPDEYIITVDPAASIMELKQLLYEQRLVGHSKAIIIHKYIFLQNNRTIDHYDLQDMDEIIILSNHARSSKSTYMPTFKWQQADHHITMQGSCRMHQEIASLTDIPYIVSIRTLGNQRVHVDVDIPENIHLYGRRIMGFQVFFDTHYPFVSPTIRSCVHIHHPMCHTTTRMICFDHGGCSRLMLDTMFILMVCRLQSPHNQYDNHPLEQRSTWTQLDHIKARNKIQILRKDTLMREKVVMDTISRLVSWPTVVSQLVTSYSEPRHYPSRYCSTCACEVFAE